MVEKGKVEGRRGREREQKEEMRRQINMPMLGKDGNEVTGREAAKEKVAQARSHLDVSVCVCM